MARRKAGVPEYARVDIIERAANGVGHDHRYPTDAGPDGNLTAGQALLTTTPTLEMLRQARQVMDWLEVNGATHIDCVPDIRPERRPGGLTIRWIGDPKTRETAEHFAVGHKDGLPLLPAWLSLDADDDFDLRWKHPY